jgi:RHS repeat-associated protein
MMLSFFARLFIRSFILLLSFLTPGFAQENSNQSPEVFTKFAVPNHVGSDGAFSYSVDFDVPEFRNLVPKFGLRYNSNFKGLGSSEVWLGVGWQLKGFSSIERVSVGGGTPSYSGGRDIYRLDGVDLLACPGSSFLKNNAYPKRYIAENSSASCAAGGDFTTLVESYRKINKSAGGFIVTSTSGVTYTYKSFGDAKGWKPGGSKQRNNASFERKFLLTRIADTQVSANSVSISYSVEGSNYGFAYRPKQVKYAGYVINFIYQRLGQPLATFAAGGPYLGKQMHRLSAVTVKDGNTKIRAYGFEYELSQGTNRSLLQEVKAYGGNYKFGNNATLLGEQLPSPLRKLQYTQRDVNFTPKTYPGEIFHTSVYPVDWDLNGVQELLFLNEERAYFSYGRDSHLLSVPKVHVDALGVSNWADARRISISRDGDHSSIENEQLSDLVGELYLLKGANDEYGETESFTRYSLHTLTATSPVNIGNGRWEPRNYLIRSKINRRAIYEGEYNGGYTRYEYDREYTLHQIDENGSAAGNISLGSFSGYPNKGSSYQYSMQNFDQDPELEIYAVEYEMGGSYFGPRLRGYHRVYNFDGNKASPLFSFDQGNSAQVEARIDLDGDGALEEIYDKWGYNWVGGNSKDIDVVTSFSSFGAYEQIIVPDVMRRSDLRDAQARRSAIYTGADVNGDGKRDLVTVSKHGSRNAVIKVALSTGPRLSSPKVWASRNSGSDVFFQALADYFNEVVPGEHYTDGPLQQASIFAADVNGDGLDDIILHSGHSYTRKCVFPDPDWNYDPRERVCKQVKDRFGSFGAKVFISNGTGFTPAETAGSMSGTEIPDYVSHADLDGNGLPDFVIEGENGKILFNDSEVPHLLTGMQVADGGVISVGYTPSPLAGADNDIPRVFQLATSISKDNGRGGLRRETYRYTGAKYDYQYRRSLGYKTVTACLPVPGDETQPPKICHSDGSDNYKVTVFDNSHIGARGRVLSFKHIAPGGLQRATYNKYSKQLAGNGPYRLQKTATIERVRFGRDSQGGGLVETRSDFQWTAFGQIKRRVDYGFVLNGTSGSFVDLDPSDTITETKIYQENTKGYIVNRPWFQQIEQARTTSWRDRSNWIKRRYFHYDGQPRPAVAPISGNLTGIRRWNGNVESRYVRTHWVDRFGYDEHGNMLWNINARGHVSRYAYDSVKKLFRIRETNPRGHSVSTVWNTACQAPSKVTDANGRQNRFKYDTHCREVMSLAPSGAKLVTKYEDLGDPRRQRIETYQNVPVGLAHEDQDLVTKEYFDGFGDPYLSYSTSKAGNGLGTLTRFDELGRAYWTSTPYYEGDLSDPAQQSMLEGTTGEFDFLGRAVRSYAPNGGLSETRYELYAIGSGVNTIQYPAIRTRNPDCFDGDANTACLESLSVFDARGHKIRMIKFDREGTDADGAGVNRITEYAYDSQGNLLSVIDPGGATWAYEYDIDSNRIVADDPALGIWRMSYDRAGNLIRQTDAKGQVITFAYDVLQRITQKRVNNGSNQITTTYQYDQANSLGRYNKGQLTKVNLETEHGLHRIEYGYGLTGGLTQERHSLGSNSYSFKNTYHPTGALLSRRLPGVTEEITYSYDWAQRLETLGNASNAAAYIQAVSYNRWSIATQTRLGNGAKHQLYVDDQMGWIDRVHVASAPGTQLGTTKYTRAPSGRIIRQEINDAYGNWDYCYDYAGRLLVAANLKASAAGQRGLSCTSLGNWYGNSPQDQFFTYRRDGSLASNSSLSAVMGQTIAYDYNRSPVPHMPSRVGQDRFIYDPNGNMTTGLHGKVISYDGENRPLEVTHAGNVTRYIYGADGKRLVKSERVNGGDPQTTYYHGELEIKPDGTQLLYLHDLVRLEDGAAVAYLHRDQLNSVRAITDRSGNLQEQRVYDPYGTQHESLAPAALTAPLETKGWIGERFDADAALQYLNARYYDPKLAMFIQPDWWEGTKPGVGTNRYAYSAGDPINLMDPGGNYAQEEGDFPNEEMIQRALVFRLKRSKKTNAKSPIQDINRLIEKMVEVVEQ